MGQATQNQLTPPHPAIEPLNGVLHALDRAKGGPPSPEVLEQIAGWVRDALTQLRSPDPDPVTRRINLVMLTLRESTDFRTRIDPITKHTITEVEVLDADLYEWAMGQVHVLVSWTPRKANGNG